ncbi:RNA polymerase sigma factor [Pedobacter sp. MC2016-24]|uniref:RNA polymerase sigma factor n=1 Tax=Pedobacter sp. MC2016-24 TaxID=2780090 RepID=UPI0018830330|nr:RNA polymerase sigma-70 factor [Pedobacter sp. MC2016-24]MBE9602428.1 RNA polymerase sigma-70 factor [Pedobacter sp. MC2016-24]
MGIGSTEKANIIALKGGDESAFRLVFDLNFKKLYTFCYRLLKNKEQAEEVVNDTFLNVWINRGRLNEDLSISPYLYTISRRLALNSLRQIATSQKAVDQLWLTMEKVSNDTEEAVILADLQRFTEAALVNLTPQQQVIFRMSRYEGLNYDEIAAKLNLSRNTVKNHLIAGLKLLKAHFNQSDSAYFLLIALSFIKK